MSIVYKGRVLSIKDAEAMVADLEAKASKFGMLQDFHQARADALLASKTEAQDDYCALQDLLHDAKVAA